MSEAEFRPPSRATLEALDALLRVDPGQRGVQNLSYRADLGAIAEVWSRPQRILVVSGFCHQGTGQPETDGLLGCLALREAYAALGRDVFFLTDSPCQEVFEETGILPLLVAPLEDLSPEEAQETFLDLLQSTEAEGVIFLERPGQAEDGNFYNVRGEPLTPAPVAFDGLLEAARSQGIPSLAFGDGGNEAGVGGLSDEDRARLLEEPRRGAQSAADHVIMAGISDWGVFAFLGLLSASLSRELIPPDAWIEAWMDSALEAGAVDGITGLGEPTTDGIPLGKTLEFLALCQAASEAD